MGRPSMAAERIEQIMQATGHCLRKNGLAGTTLERVSEESGLSRSHVRHYVGNRDDLLRKFAGWLYTGYQAEFIDRVAAAPQREKLAMTMDYLFSTGFLPISDDDTVIRELITAGVADESIRATLQGHYTRAIQTVEDAIAAEHPGAPAGARRSVAYGLWCLAMGNSMMAELQLPVASGGLVRTAAEGMLEKFNHG
ncbi:AcrR family transcriptional regulator [Actinoplanes lutulentus]|uniref:AcrR family transcriptional regulator n=1 Tax=Actinoplanes lutulentus TaxID=1287878 RepID=A0A327ZHL1_9ACTN|nr:TetR/AcrR family transcriptional regulator [Actinoplanes lutulentus]MBB2944330.1 AcrR family transcriptional regulator [Actinoplanes lutulentus]RAK42437.1 AcrR family transcriptional regulator [Actinoplanes lutulentus]